MESQIPPPPPAHSNNAGVSVAEECTRECPEDGEQARCESVADLDPQKRFREQASQILSYMFPKAKEFLLERFAISVEQRRARFLDWQTQGTGAENCSKRARELTEFEEDRNFQKPPELQDPPAQSKECTKWNNINELPKPPGINHSKSHFICNICFRSTPLEEAAGDLWL